MISKTILFVVVSLIGFTNASGFSAATQNLYHYNTRLEERRENLFTEINTYGIADVIGFQEAARWVGVKSLYDSFMVRSAYQGIYENTNQFGVMNEGIALVSRLTASELKSWYLPETEKLSKQAFNIGFFESEFGKILVVNVHLSPFPENSWRRLAQAKYILQKVNALRASHPVVILGDLNDSYESEVLKVFRDQGFKDVLDGNGITFSPRENPLVKDKTVPESRLDYILYQPAKLRVLSASLIFKTNWVSDHYGLKVEFALNHRRQSTP